MFCRKCGEELTDGAVYCGSCGEKVSKNSVESAGVTTGSLTVVGPQQMQNEGYLFSFPGRSPDTVAQLISNLFQQEDYRLEEGTTMNGVYGIGSGGAKRLLGGAFSKRYRFQCIIHEIDGVTSLEIYKAMSGMSGGIIGIRKLNEEFERIRTAIKSI